MLRRRLYTLILLAAWSLSIPVPVPAQFPLWVPQATNILPCIVPTLIDPDAAAFFRAAAITNLTEKCAVNQLVIDLKGYGVWTKYSVIYPFVGSTASSQKYNLKDPRDLDAAFRGTFHNTITSTSTGVAGNGVNGYIDTHFNETVNAADDNIHVSFYSRSDFNQLGYDTGVTDASGWGTYIISMYTASVTANTITICMNSGNDSLPVADSLGYFSVNRTSSIEYRKAHRSASTTVTQDSNRPPVNGNYYLMAYRTDGDIPSGFSSRQYAWYGLGQGLTQVQDANVYAAVQAFETTLGRNV